MLDLDPTHLKARWAVFEPVLETGQAPRHADSLGPELGWVRAVAADLGAVVTGADLARIEADWDLNRRQALLDPPPSAVATLVALRERGVRLGVLSNTHGMVILAEEAAATSAPDDLPRLRAQADASVRSLTDVVGLVDR